MLGVVTKKTIFLVSLNNAMLMRCRWIWLKDMQRLKIKYRD